jgi:hypothetical protein
VFVSSQSPWRAFRVAFCIPFASQSQCLNHHAARCALVACGLRWTTCPRCSAARGGGQQRGAPQNTRRLGANKEQPAGSRLEVDRLFTTRQKRVWMPPATSCAIRGARGGDIGRRSPPAGPVRSWVGLGVVRRGIQLGPWAAGFGGR